MATYGTDNAYGVPVTLALSYNGVATPWGTANLYSMAPLENRSESVDGGYEISNLDVQLIDTDGSIWGTLGNGTTAFNKEFSATVYIGGSMGPSSYGPQGESRLEFQGVSGAARYTVHRGLVVSVSKSNRLVRIKSQNNLRNIGDLEWRFPYHQTVLANPTVIGSYIFYSENLGSGYPNSMFERNEQSDAFSLYAAVGTDSTIPPSAKWPSIAGRGTLGLLPNYFYPGTQFFSDLTIAKFTGSWIGTFVGTITDDSEAQRYGFSNVSDADTARSGTRYIINKTRILIRNGTLPAGSVLILQQNLRLTETPANLFQEMVAGHCVTPVFTTANIDPTTFATSQRNAGFQEFSQWIDPKGGKVVPYIKDLFDSTHGLFAVNTDNLFEFRAYGPIDLQLGVGTINGTNLLDSSVDNNIEDNKNRVVINYEHDFESGEFRKRVELRGSFWSGTTDNPITIDSKWIRNENEAEIFASRVLGRFLNTVPAIEVTVPLKYAGVNLGSLFVVSDPDSGLYNSVMEITGYSKDFADGKKIVFRGIDGGALYVRRGFGFWCAGPTKPSGPTTGTSTLGWGTAGTTANINTGVYGTQFIWW